MFLKIFIPTFFILYFQSFTIKIKKKLLFILNIRHLMVFNKSLFELETLPFTKLKPVASNHSSTSYLRPIINNFTTIWYSLLGSMLRHAPRNLSLIHNSSFSLIRKQVVHSLTRASLLFANPHSFDNIPNCITDMK